MNLSNDIYYRKYLKYKTKYLEMKGGRDCEKLKKFGMITDEWRDCDNDRKLEEEKKLEKKLEKEIEEIIKERDKIIDYEYLIVNDLGNINKYLICTYLDYPYKQDLCIKKFNEIKEFLYWDINKNKMVKKVVDSSKDYYYYREDNEWKDTGDNALNLVHFKNIIRKDNKILLNFLKKDRYKDGWYYYEDGWIRYNKNDIIWKENKILLYFLKKDGYKDGWYYYENGWQNYEINYEDINEVIDLGKILFWDPVIRGWRKYDINDTIDLVKFLYWDINKNKMVKKVVDASKDYYYYREDNEWKDTGDNALNLVHFKNIIRKDNKILLNFLKKDRYKDGWYYYEDGWQKYEKPKPRPPPLPTEPPPLPDW